MRRVLISHSWSKPEQYTQLQALLARHEFDFYNHSISIDNPLPVASEEQLRAELSDRISRVSTILVLATDDTHKRPTLTFEVEEAIRQGKRVVAVKPWGEAEAPVPRLVARFADAIVGFQGEQIIRAVNGINIRNLTEYLIAEEEDIRTLAHWVARGAAGTVILASLTLPQWLPKLNGYLAAYGIQVKLKGAPPTLDDVLIRTAVGSAIGLGIGLIAGDKRLATSLTLVGGAIGAGSVLVQSLTLEVFREHDHLRAVYLPE